VVYLYELEEGSAVIKAFQLPPFIFAGVPFPAGSWIFIDLVTGHRRPATDAQFQKLHAEYGYHAVEHIDVTPLDAQSDRHGEASMTAYVESPPPTPVASTPDPELGF
jgi:hypothetical protein